MPQDIKRNDSNYTSLGLRSKIKISQTCPRGYVLTFLWNDLKKCLYDLKWLKYCLNTCVTFSKVPQNISTIHCDIFVKINYEMSIQKCLYIEFVLCVCVCPIYGCEVMMKKTSLPLYMRVGHFMKQNLPLLGSLPDIH